MRTAALILATACLAACSPGSNDPTDSGSAYTHADVVRTCRGSSDVIMRERISNRLLLHRAWLSDRWIADGLAPENVCP